MDRCGGVQVNGRRENQASAQTSPVNKRPFHLNLARWIQNPVQFWNLEFASTGQSAVLRVNYRDRLLQTCLVPASPDFHLCLPVLSTPHPTLKEGNSRRHIMYSTSRRKPRRCLAQKELRTIAEAIPKPTG